MFYSLRRGCVDAPSRIMSRNTVYGLCTHVSFTRGIGGIEEGLSSTLRGELAHVTADVENEFRLSKHGRREPASVRKQPQTDRRADPWRLGVDEIRRLGEASPAGRYWLWRG